MIENGSDDTIIISGGSGFAGRHLAARLIPECRHVHLMDKMGSLPASLSQFKEKITVHQVDLTAPRGLAQMLEEIRPQEIYHLAGIANVKHSWDGEAVTFQVNVIGAVNLVSAIGHANLNTRLLIVGSGEVYGDVSAENQPIEESCSVSPRSPYAASKVCQEVAVRQMSRHIQGKVVYVRPFNHIGPAQNPSFVASDFARQVARIEQNLQPPVIRVGNLSARRDFTDVRDTVDAYVCALRDGGDQTIYNVSSGRSLPIQYLLDYFLSLSSKSIEVVVDPDKFRPADVAMLCGSFKRLHRDTGWQPGRAIDETLSGVLNYWRQQTQSN